MLADATELPAWVAVVIALSGLPIGAVVMRGWAAYRESKADTRANAKADRKDVLDEFQAMLDRSVKDREAIRDQAQKDRDEFDRRMTQEREACEKQAQFLQSQINDLRSAREADAIKYAGVKAWIRFAKMQLANRNIDLGPWPDSDLFPMATAPATDRTPKPAEPPKEG